MRLKFRTLVAANTAIFMSETMIGRLSCMKKKQGPAGTEAPAGPIQAAKGSGLLLLLELLRDDALRQRPRAALGGAGRSAGFLLLGEHVCRDSADVGGDADRHLDRD